jgi:hypothetical protein
MYHEETPKWIYFLRGFVEIAIVISPAKLQATFTYGGIPGTYLGPAEGNKGDTYTFWNPITTPIGRAF